MRSILLSLTCILFLSAVPLHTQPQLSVSIDIPPVTVDVSAEAYLPQPLPVTVTIHNTGSSASATLSGRISLVDGLSLDSAEQSAMIKTPVPAVVPPGDSAKVMWNIRIAPAFVMKNYRVYFWLTFGTNDSLTQSALMTVPAMSPPNLSMLPTGIGTLALRPDSLGYQPNPFDVNLRFANLGGTTADSVSVWLLLPPDYVLDPATQDNPIVYTQPVAPSSAGGPRDYHTWHVRYLGATRTPRVDTMRFVARGKNRADAWMEFHAETVVFVEGMDPVFEISFRDPGAMQYDTSTIFLPHPYPLVMRLTNASEQWTGLDDVEMELFGDGISTTDAPVRTLPALAPGSHLDVTWNLDVERRFAPRQVAAEVTVADFEGKTKTAVQIIAIPGQPYALTVQDITAPDSLPRNAEGTALLTRDIPLAYHVQNDTWYNGIVNHVRVQSQGQGIHAPPWKEHMLSLPLRPGERTAALRDTFSVEPALEDRTVSFRITAVSNRGDTAVGMTTVRIPGVQPVLELTRSGPDGLTYQSGGGYAPNPFAQTYVLHNRGSVTVPVDSIVLTHHTDGISTPQPLRRDIGWNLAPGDSLATRWDFAAAVRDTARSAPFTVRAHFAREHQVILTHRMEIPGLAPVVDATVSGPDTLAYDPDSLYDPNPFTKILTIHNPGRAPLQIDSIVLHYDDPLVTAVTPAAWTTGTVVDIDSTVQLGWTLRADAHDEEKDLALTFAVYHSGTKREDVSARVFIPALRPGLDVIVVGNEQLLYDEETIYRPDPFMKTVRVINSGTADLMVDSITVSFTDPLLESREGRIRVVGRPVAPGTEKDYDWHFHTRPHGSQGYVLIDFTLYHSGGEALLLRSKIFVPGEPFSFSLTDVQMPLRLEPRADGQGYENNPVLLSYVVDNNAWFTTDVLRTDVRLEGEGVQMLTPQPVDPGLSLDPQERSMVLRDSFFVLPAMFDRTITVRIHAAGNRGMEDSTTLSLFVPQVTTTQADRPAFPEHFAIEALYPNPVLSGSTILNARIRGERMVRYEIVDILGRVLRKAHHAMAYGSGVLRIDIGGLQQGRYVLRVISAEGARSRAFVVLR